MSSEPFAVTLKTAVNTRAPLSERVPRSKRNQAENIVSATTALHHGIHTTYDAAFGSVPARTDPSHGNVYLASLRSRQLRSATTDKTGSPCGVDTRLGSLSMSRHEKSPSWGLKKVLESESVLTRHLPSEWTTEAQASSRAVLPAAPRDFYSTVRKIEREDDDQRGGLVGNTQRTVNIMRKRANDPQLCPALNVFRTFRPVRPPCETDASGHPARYCLDIVDCTQLAPPTEAQLGFDAGPIARLPDAAVLPQSLDVQERVITRMGTSKPLFGGTAKVKESALPLYGGHVPSHPKNIALQRGNDTDPRRIWSKSFMTLAEHGGGTDASTICKNPLVRSRKGTHARQQKELPPKSVKAICTTVEGSMLRATLTDTLPEERAMNRRDDKNSTLFA